MIAEVFEWWEMADKFYIPKSIILFKTIDNFTLIISFIFSTVKYFIM